MTPERSTDTRNAPSAIAQPSAAGTHLDTNRAWHQQICATLLSEWHTCRSADGLLWLAQLVGVPLSIIETARASLTSEFGSAHCAEHGGDRVRQLISVDVVTMALAAVRSPSTAGRAQTRTTMHHWGLLPVESEVWVLRPACGASAPILVTGMPAHMYATVARKHPAQYCQHCRQLAQSQTSANPGLRHDPTLATEHAPRQARRHHPANDRLRETEIES